MGTESLQAPSGAPGGCLSHCLLSLCYVPVAYMHYHMTLLYVHEDDCYTHFPSNFWNFPVRDSLYNPHPVSQGEKKNREAPRALCTVQGCPAPSSNVGI